MPQSRNVLTHRWQPDLIVGIDFGMTCTAVVYARLDSKNDALPKIKLIKRWPGATEILEKVPSEIIYGPDGKTVQSWGAECKRNPGGWHRCKKWFKLSIPDQSTYTDNDAESATTLMDHHDGESARRYFEDYLTKLCKYVDGQLQDEVSGYWSLKVEFAFTVPTSWRFDPVTFDQISTILKRAVGVHRTRQAKMGLTEAAAAGSESGKDANKKGDVVLVVDTGGGTTDLNIYKYQSSEKEAARIKGLTREEGDDVGSARIDQSCIDYLTLRINEVCGRNAKSWMEHIQPAVQEHFNAIKYSYGEAPPPPRGYELLPIGPTGHNRTSGMGLAPASDFVPPEGDYGTYYFRIPNREIKRWFDDQITAITGLIDKQLTELQREHRWEKVDRVVLSGGFSVNKYYRSKLHEYFAELRRNRDGRVSSSFEILNAHEPHLAVANGLVYNRIREVMGMGSTYEYVVSPLSFGFVMSEKYRWFKHHNSSEVPHESPLDGKRWIQGQIDWIIEEGVSIPSKGMRKSYDVLLPGEEETLPQTIQIVSCANPRKNLPRNISHNAVKSVCEIKIDLTKLAIEKRKSRSLSMSKPSRQNDQAPTEVTKVASFDLWVLIGAADLRFEVKPKGEANSLASLEHEQIDIAWANMGDKAQGKNASSEDVEAVRREVIMMKASR